MSSEPSRGERELLLAMEEYERQYGVPVNSKWLQTRLKIGDTTVSNRACSLRKKGYLKTVHGVYSFTQKAVEYLMSLRIVFPTEIPILGKVRAGQAESGDLCVEMNLADEVIPTISIPNLSHASEVYALQVFGKSMEAENIVEGDFVLVRKFRNSEGPKQGQLIVVRYIATCDEPYLEEFGDALHDLFRGPVLKRYYAVEKGEYRLSTTKDFIKNPHTIRTKHIDPVGVVVSMYRNLT